MLDFAKACGVAAFAALLVAEGDRFLQGLEAGLAQQDRVAAGGRAFNHGLRRDALGRHAELDCIDIQGTRGQVVDVRALEGHHIGDQAVLVVQLLVLLGRDGSVLVPAEGVQRFLHERLCIRGVKATLALTLGDQFEGAGGEDLALGQDALCQLAQLRVVDQLQAQQRGEHTERADMQRLLVHRAKGSGMHRYASGAEVIIADRLHAHDGEQAGDGGQFFGGADADGAVTFLVQALDFAGPAQGLCHFGLLGHHLLVDFAHQLQQRAVQRHFLFVHERHGGRELRADAVWADEIVGGHR